MAELRVSFVVIGLDEASHLEGSIRSLRDQGVAPQEMEILYVDSSSTDGSPEIAKLAGADLVLTISRIGASAARARNTGLARARGRFVQFVDGDTSLEPDWVTAALRALEADSQLAGVEGHLIEAHPSANLYHAVCELDWPARSGPTDYVGGNSIYRRDALERAGGFDPRMVVGEEPELGWRMRRDGARFVHLDVPMARHDLDLRGFGDYWTRGRKSGQSCAMVAMATGGVRSGYWSRRLWTTLLHSSWLSAPWIAAALVLPFSAQIAAWLALVPAALLASLALRKASGLRSRGLGWGLALACGLHAYLFKVPGAVGALRALASGLPDDSELERRGQPVAGAPGL